MRLTRKSHDFLRWDDKLSYNFPQDLYKLSKLVDFSLTLDLIRYWFLYRRSCGLSDSPDKARVVYVILLIAIMWHVIDESTQKTHFFHSVKKKKKKRRRRRRRRRKKEWVSLFCATPHWRHVTSVEEVRASFGEFTPKF